MGFFNKDNKNAETPAAPISAPDKPWRQRAYTPSYIWENKISWRITLTVFATILLVQTAVLVFTAHSYEQEQLGILRDTARTSMVASLDNIRDQTISPLDDVHATRLIDGTIFEGIAIYALDHTQLKTYGVKTLLQPKLTTESIGGYRSADKSFYEIIFAPGEVGRPYSIVARLDAKDIAPRVESHIKQNLWILLFLSGFVTSVLMLALSQWLLEPIMLLRSNLLSAAKNPERPDIRRTRKETSDEIGTTIRIANDLIRQNANNIKKLHSTAEDKIHRLAYFDSLTGLPNRTFFIEKLEDAIKHKIIEEDGKLAVITIDLDHFKDINDTMGHEVGDKLLEAIGKRIVKCLPDDAIVARASADEFIAMVHLRTGQPDSAGFVERIFAAMAEPVSIVQERFQVRVSIGVTHCPDDGMDAKQILKNSDIALNRAKEEGRDTVRYYSQDFDKAIQARFQMLRDLRVAMDQKQLRLHYHPQFDLRTGALIGAEALLRWWKPDNSKEGGRFISPVDFIPVAEQSGLIVPIGEYVLRTACDAMKDWQARGLPPVRIAVNISGVQFHRGDVVALVETVLQETQLPPHLLELEVTESVFMENMQVAIDILHKLHSLGVELAVDDFGTGYSSLSYLRQFPIDRLKIDQSFTRNALINKDDRAITKTIITLGHSLGLKVIAEGVETAEHENFLKEEGCDESQGFKYSKPIPADDFFIFAQNHNRAIAAATTLTAVENKA